MTLLNSCLSSLPLNRVSAMRSCRRIIPPGRYGPRRDFSSHFLVECRDQTGSTSLGESHAPNYQTTYVRTIHRSFRGAGNTRRRSPHHVRIHRLRTVCSRRRRRTVARRCWGRRRWGWLWRTDQRWKWRRQHGTNDADGPSRSTGSRPNADELYDAATAYVPNAIATATVVRQHRQLFAFRKWHCGRSIRDQFESTGARRSSGTSKPKA